VRPPPRSAASRTAREVPSRLSSRKFPSSAPHGIGARVRKRNNNVGAKLVFALFAATEGEDKLRPYNSTEDLHGRQSEQDGDEEGNARAAFQSGTGGEARPRPRAPR